MLSMAPLLKLMEMEAVTSPVSPSAPVTNVLTLSSGPGLYGSSLMPAIEDITLMVDWAKTSYRICSIYPPDRAFISSITLAMVTL